jgi:Protein of unknown function (DUF3886)
MANNKRKQQKPNSPATSSEQADKPVTLKDRLGAGIVEKLKQQAETMKQEEAKQRETKRIEAEAAKLAEQKLKEKDFEYLLNNSTADWKKYN